MHAPKFQEEQREKVPTHSCSYAWVTPQNKLAGGWKRNSSTDL